MQHNCEIQMLKKYILLVIVLLLMLDISIMLFVASTYKVCFDSMESARFLRFRGLTYTFID